MRTLHPRSFTFRPSVMRRFLTWLALALAACRGENRDPAHATDDSSEVAVDSRLPGPARAAAAARRVRPILEPDLKAKSLRWGDPLFFRAFKEERELEVWVLHPEEARYHKFRTYPIAAASGALGPKLAEGDGQVPEGFYAFGARALKPDSAFHLAINIGYPNAFDRHHGRTGSFIMIHGGAASVGCLAMTDPKIEEIFTLASVALEHGQPFIRVHLFPFRMTGDRLENEGAGTHRDFWAQLKAGYDFFEEHRLPPEVGVEDGRYAFRAAPAPSPQPR